MAFVTEPVAEQRPFYLWSPSFDTYLLYLQCMYIYIYIWTEVSACRERLCGPVMISGATIFGFSNPLSSPVLVGENFLTSPTKNHHHVCWLNPLNYQFFETNPWNSLIFPRQIIYPKAWPAFRGTKIGPGHQCQERRHQPSRHPVVKPQFGDVSNKPFMVGYQIVSYWGWFISGKVNTINQLVVVCWLFCGKILN